MIGVGRYTAVLLPFVGLLLAYYALYFRRRQWMLDRDEFERFLEGERRYKERAEPDQVEAYLERFKRRRRRFVAANTLVFACLGLGLFLGLVYLRARQ